MTITTATWLHLLAAEIELSPRFLATLDAQLRDHARRLIGVDDIANGDYSLMPPDEGFTVEFRRNGVEIVGVIEGYLVDPTAFGHPVAFAWRTHAADRPVLPDADRDDVECFWIEFPVAALIAGTRVDVTEVAAAIAAPFPIEWDVHRWDAVWLAIHAGRAFIPEERDALDHALRSVVDDYVAAPSMTPDATTIEWYLDLGGAGANVVVAAINTIGALPIASAITRCTVGRRRAG